MLTGNRLRWTVRCGRPPLLLPSCRKLEFRLSALMDSDLAWVNGKSGRQSWRYANAFQRSIISKTIYHLPHFPLTYSGTDSPFYRLTTCTKQSHGTCLFYYEKSKLSGTESRQLSWLCTCMQPAFLINCFPRRCLVIQITLHDLWTTYAQLTSLVWTNRLLCLQVNHLQTTQTCTNVILELSRV